jgi:hypothetical protein
MHTRVHLQPNACKHVASMGYNFEHIRSIEHSAHTRIVGHLARMRIVDLLTTNSSGLAFLPSFKPQAQSIARDRSSHVRVNGARFAQKRGSMGGA